MTKMKIAYGSDLHLEFTESGPSLENIKGIDLLILAGDIDVGYAPHSGEPKAIDYAKQCAETLKCPVVIINGNHEYYNSIYQDYLADCCRYVSKLDNVYFLENEVVEIGGARILGATLWTDMNLYSMPTASGKAAERNISDYFLIRTRGQDHADRQGDLTRLTAADTIAFNKASKDFLMKELNKPYNGKTIVVTHFPPIPFSHPRFDGDTFSPYFSNDWGMDIRAGFLNPDLWVCGHTHYNDDLTIGHTRIVAAQRGYPNELGKFEWGVVEF